VDEAVDEMWKTRRLSEAVDKLLIHPQVLHRPSTGFHAGGPAKRRVFHSFHSTDYYDDSYLYREIISNSPVNNRASSRRSDP
jgi:hypothetical protein